MTFMDIGRLITKDSELSGGRPVITGTGTSVRRIVIFYKQGLNPEEIASCIQELTLAQIYAALTYYHANREEIEEDLATEKAEYWRLAELLAKKVRIQS